MTELTVDRVRSAVNTAAPAVVVSDYIKLLDKVGFREVMATDEEAMIALGLDHASTLARKLNHLYTYGLATRKRFIEHRRGRSAYCYTLKDGE